MQNNGYANGGATVLDTASAADPHQPDHVRALGARTSTNSPEAPPWAWPNLNQNEAGWLDQALDEYVETYNRIHAANLDEVIPPCWRLHPALAQELPVQFWAWWTSHIAPSAHINAALDFYSRHLPGFQQRLAARLLGKSAGSCRKGQHTRGTDPDLVDAISLAGADQRVETGRSARTRETLRQTDFGTRATTNA